MKNKYFTFVTVVAVILMIGMVANSVLAAQDDNSVQAIYVVRPGNLQGWAFNGAGTNTFMTGPLTPPYGTGSVQLSIAGAANEYTMYSYARSGTLINAITTLSYSTYHSSSGTPNVNQLPALILNVDYDTTDADTTWQGSLVFDPYRTAGNTPAIGSWQTWNAYAGLWWATDPPWSTECPPSDPCLLSELIAPSEHPNLGIMGGLGFRVGSGWTTGFIGNVDNFVFAANGSTDTYDFELGTNSAPVLGSIGNKSGDELTLITFTATATDPADPADILIFSLDAVAPSGASINPSTGAFTWTPTEAQGPGVYPVTVRVTDNGTPNLSDFEQIQITVNEVNVAPVANSQSVTTAEDTAKAITLTASDVDVNPLTWAIVSPPAHGALTGTAPALTYTPAANYIGPDSFTFRVFDGTVYSNVATVTITITPVNDAPVANSQSVITAEDTAKAITLIATDIDGNTLSWIIVAGPTHGTLTGTSPALSYTPAVNYNGPDSFTFKVNDGTVDSNIATVTITVTPVMKTYYLYMPITLK